MLTVRILAITSVVALGAIASATDAFNDYGPGNGGWDYNASSGWTVGGTPVFGDNYSSAQQFTSGASGVLADLIVPIGLVEGSGPITVQLYSDNGGNQLGSALYTWTNVGTTGTFGNWSMPETLTASGGPSLSAGTSYWVVMSAIDQPIWAAWNQNSVGVNGNYGFFSSGAWAYYSGPTGAMEVDVQATPEPAAFGLLGLGALALVRRKRK